MKVKYWQQMGWRVKQICTVAPELCPILEGRSKHDETNLEKCFLGFPTSTHASSLGYKKAEAANLQQSCILTCSTIQCDNCKRQSLPHEATARECILLSRPRGSSFPPRTAVAAWLWRWCLWECLHCQLRERGCWNPGAQRHSASGWQSSFVEKGVWLWQWQASRRLNLLWISPIQTNCKYAIDVLHMICFLVLFSHTCRSIQPLPWSYFHMTGCGSRHKKKAFIFGALGFLGIAVSVVGVLLFLGPSSNEGDIR